MGTVGEARPFTVHIPEKLQRWRDCDGDLKQSLSRDDVLTDVTIYWVTGSINASFWRYYDRPHRGRPFRQGRIGVPTGYAKFPREILHPRRVWAERGFDLRRWTRMPRGGQFAALEAPDLLADDVPLPTAPAPVTFVWPPPLISLPELAARLDRLEDVAVHDGLLKAWARDPACPMEGGPPVA